MPKKARKQRVDDIFVEIRKKLPFAYLDELAKILPTLDRRQILYAQERRCTDLNLKDQVYKAMVKLANRKQKLAKKFSKLPA